MSLFCGVNGVRPLSVWLARVPLIHYFATDRVQSLLAGVGHYRFGEVDVDIQVLIIVILVLGIRIGHASLAHISYLGVNGDRFREQAASLHQIVIRVTGHLSDLLSRCLCLCLWLSHRSVIGWIPNCVPHAHNEGVSEIHFLDGAGLQNFNLCRYRRNLL
jgi:hypothetical protein